MTRQIIKHSLEAVRLNGKLDACFDLLLVFHMSESKLNCLGKKRFQISTAAPNVDFGLAKYTLENLCRAKVQKNQPLSLTKSKNFLLVYLRLCDFVSLKKNDTHSPLTKCQGSRSPAWAKIYNENPHGFARMTLFGIMNRRRSSIVLRKQINSK